MLPCVLLEGNLTVCVAFDFFDSVYFSYETSVPKKDLDKDEKWRVSSPHRML